MKFFNICTIISVLVLLKLKFVNSQGNGKVVCNYQSWAFYRKGLGMYDVNNIPVEMCTHFIYSHVGIRDNFDVDILDSWRDIDKKGFENFGKLKVKKPNAITLVSIGGWSQRASNYSIMMSNPNSRSIFVKNAIDFVKNYNFNGLDLDIEYPGDRTRGGSYTDKKNFLSLVQELKTAFVSYGFHLTMAVPIQFDLVENGYIVSELCQIVDAVHVMTYDISGTWNRVADVNAPLYSKYGLSVQSGLMNWVNNGCPSSKMIVGIPFYGRTFTLSDTSDTDIGAPISGPGKSGEYTQSEGILAYYEICSYLKTSSEWTVKYDIDSKCPYAYKGNQWIGFDDPQSIQEKMNFIKSNKFGGVMAWSIDMDDFQGICGARNPLLSVIYNSMKNYIVTSSTSGMKPAAAPAIAMIETASSPQPVTTDCSKGDNILPVPNKCRVYIRCCKGQTIKVICPAKLVFHTTRKTCVKPKNADRPECRHKTIRLRK